MNRAQALGVAILWIAALSSGCGDTASKDDGAAGTPSGGAGGSAGQMSGSPGAGGASMDPAAGSGGGEAGAGGSGAVGGGVDAGEGGADAAVDDSGTIGEIPEPVSEPQVWGFGLGITDIPEATKFFTDVMKLSVEKEAVQRDGWTETVMYSESMTRAARLSLMKFDDMRNTRNVTAKLIWQVQDTAAVDSAASMHEYTGYVQRLDFGYLMFDGPETYVQELGTSFDPEGASFEDPYIVAIGFAVSDPVASSAFYVALGMTDMYLGSYSISDATGTGTVGEYALRFGTGMAIVLQDWEPARETEDRPVKMVFVVPDAKAMADKVVAAGGTIVTPAARSEGYDNRLLVVAKDLDGYILDLVE